MPFSEAIKKLARQKAHFVCVVCRSVPFVEVHHIIPESEGGPNTIENAAPLCAGCHDLFGNNPDKRKQIRDMRDQWYEICEKRYMNPDIGVHFEKINELYETQQSIKEDQEKQKELLIEIKDTLLKAMDATGSSISKSISLDSIIADSGNVTSGARLADNVYANVKCERCGTQIGLLVGANKCPNCGNPIK